MIYPYFRTITCCESCTYDVPIYQVEYEYDKAGRLTGVREPLLGGENNWIAEFGYDKNGNRSELKYHLDNKEDGNTTTISYTYNHDNLLTGYSTSSMVVTGPTFTFEDVNVGGLGRLKDANETITNTSQNPLAHNYTFSYDMRSQLTDANITNIGGSPWAAKYFYHHNGNMAYRIIQSDSQTFSYTGHQMTNADGNTLDYDENGQLTAGAASESLIYNWDGKLRHAEKDSATIDLKYDPSGNRIYKDSGGTARKYIVDIVGDLPVILVVLDNSQNVLNRYLYANSQIVAQHDVDDNNKLYFYLHDRLGSVRMLMDTSGDVKNVYTYEPFGKLFATETTENISNPFKFTGQYFDSEIDEYYLRARQYDPYLYRFTSRDPVLGKLEQPLTLHAYLYCGNDPENRIDPSGASSRAYREFGVMPFTFEEYMHLWNIKGDPKEEKLVELSIWTAIFTGVEEATELLPPGGGAVFAIQSGGAGLLFAGPNMYYISYYRLLQHGMINAIFREDFGIDLNLYDIQDFWAGL